MSVAPAEPTPAATPEPPVATATPEPPKPTEPKATEPAANPWEDPKAAEAEIERLRKENAKDRTNAKAQAAEEARKELAQSLNKILNPDATEPIDPAKLTESLTAAQRDAKQARVELAVFRNAGTVGDPIALLDSTSFLRSLDGIDPTDEAAVQAAIASAVDANPRLGAATEPRTPAPNPAQGSSASGAPGIDAQIAEAQKAGDIQLAIALKQQRAALNSQK